MKRKISIFYKLLLIILPVVCVPVAIVGYISISTAMHHVKNLTRQELTIQLKTTANQINRIFEQCRFDLETAHKLPVFADHHTARALGLNSVAEINRNDIEEVFWDILARATHYRQVAFLDSNGYEIVSVGRFGKHNALRLNDAIRCVWSLREMLPNALYVSRVLGSGKQGGYTMLLARAFFSPSNQFSGAVLVALDFDKVIDLVKKLPSGPEGYAFLIDPLARAIAHSRLPPYSRDLHYFYDSPLKDTVEDMTFGNDGWQTFTSGEVEWVAAYSPIRSMAWSLATTTTYQSFAKDALAIESKVMQVGAIALVLSILAASLLAYNFISPVRRLVRATRRLAGGDLEQKIPISSYDELGELTASFNDMLRGLSRAKDEVIKYEKLASLGRLSAGIAHEIRNPLNAMKGAVTYMQMQETGNREINECAEVMLQEIERLNGFVSDFMMLGKLSPPDPSPTNMNDLILAVARLFKNQTSANGFHIHTNLDSGIPLISLDYNQMKQVLMNLIINAMDAMPQGGELELSTSLISRKRGSVQQTRCRISIRDQGAGIGKDQLNKIFDPYFTTKQNGTGLGLPICLRIVVSHGGRIRVNSEPGEGTTVKVDLPLDGPSPAGEVKVE